MHIGNSLDSRVTICICYFDLDFKYIHSSRTTLSLAFEKVVQHRISRKIYVFHKGT